MPVYRTVLWTDAGLAAAVAAAVTHADADAHHADPGLALLHQATGPHAPAVARAVRRQADALPRFAVLGFPGPAPDPHGPAASAELGLARRLLAAAHAALGHGADRLVWPVSVDGDETLAARRVEQALLVQHLVANACETVDPNQPDARRPRPLRIDTPLLELTDPQLVELGEELDVDWSLAWCCDRPVPEARLLPPKPRGRPRPRTPKPAAPPSSATRPLPMPEPCHACAGCERRRAAFARARVADPLSEPQGRFATATLA